MNAIRVLCLLLAAGILSACGGGNEEGGRQQADKEIKFPPPPKGIIRANLSTDPPDLDPNLCTDLPGAWVLNHLFEPLIRLNAKAQPQPAGAESWEHNEDYTVWTFHLRKNNKWHNGDPVTAHDYRYSILRLLTPETQSKSAMMVFNFLAGGEEFYDNGGQNPDIVGVECPDDYTLVLTLSNPAPYFITMLNHSAWMPLHKETVEEYGPEWIRVQNYIGNGPFRFKEYRSKDRIIVEKTDTFWDAGSIRLNEIHFLMIESDATVITAFQSGDLDVTGQMPAREAVQWKQRPEFVLGPALATYYYTFNMQEGPFTDRDLRRAMALTIKRNLITEKLSRRGETPAVGFIPPGMPMPDGRDYRQVAPEYYQPDSFDDDVKKAKDLLKEAGYAIDGAPGKSLPRGTLLFNTDDLHKDIGENVQALWKSLLGLDIQLRNVEWGVLLSRGRAHDFEMMRSAWFGDYLDPLTFLEIFETGHGNNYSGYSNPKYDELLRKIRTEMDQEKRLEHIIEAERLIVEEDCVIAPVFHYVDPVLQRTDIKNVVRTPLGGLDFTRAYREGG